MLRDRLVRLYLNNKECYEYYIALDRIVFKEHDYFMLIHHPEIKKLIPSEQIRQRVILAFVRKRDVARRSFNQYNQILKIYERISAKSS